MILLSIRYYMMKGQTCCEAGTESHGSLGVSNSLKDRRVTKHKP